MISIYIDPMRLAAYGLTVADLGREVNFPRAASETAIRSVVGFALAVSIGSLAGIIAGYSFAAMRASRPIVTVILGAATVLLAQSLWWVFTAVQRRHRRTPVVVS